MAEPDLPTAVLTGRFAEAVLALGKTRDDRAYSHLIEALKRDSYLEVIRTHALAGMAELRDERAITPRTAGRRALASPQWARWRDLVRSRTTDASRFSISWRRSPTIASS